MKMCWWRIANSLLYFTFVTSFNGSCNEATSDDGGWFTDDSWRIAQPGPCNIEIRDGSLTQEEFIEKYAYSAPVILEGVTDNSKFRIASEKENMLKKYKNKIIMLSSANTHSYRRVDVTLTKYIEDLLKPQTLETFGNDTMYWFGGNNYTEWQELFDLYVQPPFSLPHLTGVYSFGLAGPGTGVPFHFHGPGFAEVIYGRKRWFLYPPHQEPKFDPNRSTLQWLVEEYPKLSGPTMPMECTIEAGQIIYFPDHWWHGTLNIDTSVFISTFLG